MPGLTEESKILLEQTMNLISNINTEEIIKKIDMWLGVKVATGEVHLGKERLREIIEIRMLRPCPKCEGNFDINNICNLCKGTGEVNGVGEEKFFLSKARTAQT
jgi:DnaJ-class molecular chaperone